MGLIARELERRGIPTLSLSSARSITRSVNPPRAAYLDFPLGHTAGRPFEPTLNQEILLAALAGFERLERPGEIVDLPFVWADDDAWKDAVMRPRSQSPENLDEPAGTRPDETRDVGHADDRTPRHATPQYQTEEDRAVAEAELADGGCPSCVFLD